MVSIDHVLAELNIQDNSTGKLETADNFFTDWLITNYVQDGKIADGRYTYHNYPAAPDFPPTESISDCPVEASLGEVYQYGVNYIQIRCQGRLSRSTSRVKARWECCLLTHIPGIMPFIRTAAMNRI